MLTLILAEAELEPIPDVIRDHASVKAAVKQVRGKRGRRRAKPILLDSSLHHQGLQELPEGDRRGRPDLAHFFLLLALDSIGNKRGEVRTFIHTRHDELITVSPETRIMRHYPRFVGLMESLFERKQVPNDPVLLKLEGGWDLSRVVKEHAQGPVVVMHPEGDAVSVPDLVREKARDGDLTVVIGGFPKGDFHVDVRRFADHVVRLGTHEHLSVWTVLSPVLAFYEEGRGMLAPGPPEPQG